MSRRFGFSSGALRCALPGVLVCALALAAQAQQSPPSADSISREVKQIFDRAAKAVVKIHGSDEHSDLSGTGFFIDPTGTIYTAYSVGGEATNFSVEINGRKIPARRLVADVRSGIAMLKIDAASPALPIGRSEAMPVATPLVMIGFPLDLPETPNFGLVGGFDKKYLDRYLTTTHLRVNMPSQRGEAGAPLLNMQGEVVGIVVSSLENRSSLYALPIEAAEKIRSDFVRFGQVLHGWTGVNVAEAPEERDGSRTEVTQLVEGTPAANSGLLSGDVLLQVGRKEIHRPEDVIDASFFITAGEVVPITVLRGDQKITVNVQSEVHPMSRQQNPTMLAQPTFNQALPLTLERPRERSPE